MSFGKFATAAVLASALPVAIPAAGALAAPANDGFASAQALTGLPVTATGTNAGATKEPGEPAHAGSPGGTSAWWRWTAPTTGGVTIDTCDSDFDTLLGVYTGGAVSSLTAVASNNDDACAPGSAATFNATGGQLYRIAVDGSDGETGAVSLRLEPTLVVRAATVRRKRSIDATRFFVVTAAGGDEAPEPPRLTLRRGRRTVSIDLELENEGDFLSETRFRYTFNWSCARRGHWSWTASVARHGRKVAQQGSFTVPRCRRQRWYVSRRKVLRDARRDGIPARNLSCRPLGRRVGARAARWRCRLAMPGFACRGSFLYRYSRVVQGRDVVSTTRRPSGTVRCTR